MAQMFGLPAIPERASIVFDDPSIVRLDGSVQVPLARAKQIEMHGRTVDFHDGAGFDRGFEHPIVIEVVPGPVRHEPVRGVGDDVHERMRHRREVAPQELIAGVAGAVVQRCQHDVEPLENPIRKIEAAVRHDVDFTPVEDRHVPVLLPEPPRAPAF